MAPSNRHWPSMFKSKPCNTHHHQWHHDVNSSLLPNGCHKAPYASGSEERSPEPKPRWNPRPEQIRILEAIFNSGMVNPPRDEIRKIRAQLQEYGQVGDANVFYWFQNRKSRSKHKQRQLQTKAQTQKSPLPISSFSTTNIIPPTSSSSSSDKSSPNSSAEKSSSSFSIGSKNMMDLSNSPTASVNQPFLQAQTEFMPEHFFFPVQQTLPEATTSSFTQGFCFPDIMSVSQVADEAVAPCPTLFLSDLRAINHGASKKFADEKMKLDQPLSYAFATAPSTSNITVPSITHHVQGEAAGESGGLCAAKSTVFINDVAFEVEVGAFNVREAFGEDAVLIHSSGQPALTDEWGVTLQPLQPGAFYYLLRNAT